MEVILTNPIYSLQLKARENFQEIMLGYSDSNKDGGYWMANWALQKAQLQLGDVLRRHEVDFMLFHGRGRSEEHTSELQSRGHLVCRLLPEEKHPTQHK